MPVVFEIKDVPGFERWLRRQLKKGARAGALSTAMRMINVITTEIIPAESPPPVFEGFYRAGWRSEPTEDGALVVNTVPYASVIEDGARAENIKVGRAMIEALTRWVIKKGLAGKATTAKKKAEQLTQATQIAWAIAMAMKQRGIFNRGSKGLKIGWKGIQKAKKFVDEEMSREVERALGEQ